MSQSKGVSTRLMLVVSQCVLIASLVTVSLWILHSRIERAVRQEAIAKLQESLAIFHNVEEQHLLTMQRENALLADLPSLKALMTTADSRTISNGALEFWKVSGSDLFALASPDGQVRAVYVRGIPADETLRSSIAMSVSQVGNHYLISGGRLFGYAVRPLYFGDEESGTILGYVLSGYEVDRALLAQISRSSSAEAAFLSGQKLLVNTFREKPPSVEALLRISSAVPQPIIVANRRYLALSEDMHAAATGPLRLVLTESTSEWDVQLRKLDSLLIGIGVVSIIVGSGLMVLVSSWMTHSLLQLAGSVQAFGRGDSHCELPQGGTREVRQLSADFATMRRKIEETNKVLLESEKLATIGSMASSVSHDLRHYLASVYANAEFLASGSLTKNERADLLNEVHVAVTGTTDLIDSLLIFSRAGRATPRSRECIQTLLLRVLGLMRKHPDAKGVEIVLESCDLPDSMAEVNGRQIERALLNLLVNAAQAARSSAVAPRLVVALNSTSTKVEVRITDNGGGVLDSVRSRLFLPFVSEGKQNGTGLGLTLAHHVAQEHGGTVTLVESRPGHTAFVFSIKRDSSLERGKSDSQRVAPVTS